MKHLTVSIIFALLVIVGCQPQAPVLIRITPTPQPVTPQVATEIPTLEPTPTLGAQGDVEALLSPLPVSSASPTATVTPAEPSPTRTPAGDGGIISGPIIDENYSLPPTSTARPSRTPFPSEDQPTATSPVVSTPEATPMPQLPGLDRERVGVQVYYNMDVDSWNQVMYHVSQMGFRWMKLQVNWAFLQPDGPETFNWLFQLFEMHVERAKRQGYKILLSVAKAPSWARSVQDQDGPPDDPQALADFLTFMLNDTKIGQSIDAIEIWNEPNLIREWNGNLEFSGAGYMQLFRPAYDAIRAYSPNMLIVSAGLAPTGNIPDVSIRHEIFLQQMYDAGLGSYSDIIIGAHPYGWANAPDVRCCDPGDDRGWDDDPHFFFLDNLEMTYEVMARNGHGDLEVWGTEFGYGTWEGYPTDPPEFWMYYVTPELQEQYTLRALEIAQDLDYMGQMFLWNFNFANETVIEQRQEVAAYSLFYPGFQPDVTLNQRPLYWTLVNSASGPTTP